MKINPETRLLIILAIIVLLGFGGLTLLNRTPGLTPPPAPTPAATQWTSANFGLLLSKARHIRGDDKKAAVTIIEFGDLQCPSCRRAYNNYLLKLEKTMPIRFAFIHNPLTIHEDARPAALATEAAGRQGKFWEMFDLLYTGEDADLGTTQYDAAARKLGLDVKQFDADMNRPELKQLVDVDSQTGKDTQITNTPTFIIRDDKTGQVFEAIGAAPADQRISSMTHTPTLLPPTPPK